MFRVFNPRLPDIRHDVSDLDMKVIKVNYYFFMREVISTVCKLILASISLAAIICCVLLWLMPSLPALTQHNNEILITLEVTCIALMILTGIVYVIYYIASINRIIKIHNTNTEVENKIFLKKHRTVTKETTDDCGDDAEKDDAYKDDSF